MSAERLVGQWAPVPCPALRRSTRHARDNRDDIPVGACPVSPAQPGGRARVVTARQQGRSGCRPYTIGHAYRTIRYGRQGRASCHRAIQVISLSFDRLCRHFHASPPSEYQCTDNTYVLQGCMLRGSASLACSPRPLTRFILILIAYALRPCSFAIELLFTLHVVGVDRGRRSTQSVHCPSGGLPTGVSGR